MLNVVLQACWWNRSVSHSVVPQRGRFRCLWAQSASIKLLDWSNVRLLQRKIQRKWRAAWVYIVRPVVTWSLFWKVTNIYHVLFHYFVVKFSCLYKSILLFTVQWKLVALIFPQNYLLKPTFWLLSSLFLSPIKCVGWT